MDEGNVPDLVARTSELLHHWRSDNVLSVRLPQSGTINDVRVVKTDSGQFVMRIYAHRTEDRVRLEHDVLQWLGEQDAPVIVPIKRPDGTTYLVDEGRIVTLLPFASGYQIDRSKLDAAHVHEMGRFLGYLHGVLADCPVPSIPMVRFDCDPDATIAEIDRLLELIGSMADPVDTDRYMEHRLASRRAWLKETAHSEIEWPHDQCQPLHGDYQESNIFFSERRVSAIIDWDKIYLAPPGWEIARTLDLMLGFDASMSEAFVAGYRTTRGIGIEDLERSVMAYGQMRAFDLWLPRSIYEGQNERLRRFVTPGEFVPVSDRWTRIRGSLSRN